MSGVEFHADRPSNIRQEEQARTGILIDFGDEKPVEDREVQRSSVRFERLSIHGVDAPSGPRTMLQKVSALFCLAWRGTPRARVE